MIFISILSTILRRRLFWAAVLLISPWTINGGPAASPPLPPDISFPEDFVKAGGIRINLHAESGEDIPVILGTQTTGVLLDKSVEGAMGKRLGTTRVLMNEEGWIKGSRYKPTVLFLGGCPLRMDSEISDSGCVVTIDMRENSVYKYGVRGFLGMDCLRHYCFQFDTENHRIHFMDPDRLDTSALGRPLPLSIPWTNPRVLVSTEPGGLLGGKSAIALEFTGGVALKFKLFKKCIEDGEIEFPDGALRTKERPYIEGILAKATFAGEQYRNLRVREETDQNILGLEFLALHIVTFDFPHQKMYLKRLPGKDTGNPPPPAKP